MQNHHIDEASRQVHERLPVPIDYLAHQWLTGPATPAATALASHEAVRRPGKVHRERCEAFLEDMLRHTGLLVHHADALGFPHQTLNTFSVATTPITQSVATLKVLSYCERVSGPGHQALHALPGPKTGGSRPTPESPKRPFRRVSSLIFRPRCAAGVRVHGGRWTAR